MCVLFLCTGCTKLGRFYFAPLPLCRLLPTNSFLQTPTLQPPSLQTPAHRLLLNRLIPTAYTSAVSISTDFCLKTPPQHTFPADTFSTDASLQSLPIETSLQTPIYSKALPPSDSALQIPPAILLPIDSSLQIHPPDSSLQFQLYSVIHPTLI